MREIEIKIIDYINENWDTKEKKVKTFSCRDYVEITKNTVNVFLWSNLIFSISKKSKAVFFSFCGYETNTTKSRINAFLSAFSNGSIKQKNFSLFYNKGNYNAKIDSAKFYLVDNGEIKEC